MLRMYKRSAETHGKKHQRRSSGTSTAHHSCWEQWLRNRWRTPSLIGSEYMRLLHAGSGSVPGSGVSLRSSGSRMLELTSSSGGASDIDAWLSFSCICSSPTIKTHSLQSLHFFPSNMRLFLFQSFIWKSSRIFWVLHR